MRRLERGASYVPLIIVLVLLVVAVVWAYIKTDEVDKLKKDIATAESQYKSEQKARIDAFDYLRKLNDKLGFTIDPGDVTADKKSEYKTDVDKIAKWTLENLSALRDKYVRDFPVSVYTFDPNGGVKRSEPQDGMVKVGYITLGELPNDVTVENLYNHMNSAMGRMLNDITRLVGERKADQAGFDQREQQFRATVADKDKEIQRLQSERDALQSAKAQQERDLRDQINTLTEAKRTAEENLAAEQKTSKEAQAKLNNSILALKQDVQKLKQKKRMTEVPPGPDGEVLAVTSDQGIAILNRGKADHLKPGTTFEVYSIGKGARKIYKGTVLVLDVDTNKATARIEQVVNPADPIVQGDLIESVTYNPAQELHFYLLGRMQKYGKTDAAARLRQLGLKVDDSVSIDTDYVVMGAPESDTDDLRATDAYKRAQELGIPVIREQDLSRFVNY